MSSAKATVGALFRAIADRDGGACNTLFTARGLSESTGRTGADALAKCRKDFTNGQGPAPRLNEVEGVRIVGTSAWVQFTSSIGSLAKRQVLRLRAVAGDWRIDGDGSRDVEARDG